MQKPLFIYDLDHCLYDPDVHKDFTWHHFSTRLGQANKIYAESHDDGLTLEDWEEIKFMFFKEGTYKLFLQGKFGNLTEAAIKIYRELPLPDDIIPYSDIGILEKLDTVNYLVTSGFSEYQRSKVSKLGLEKYFVDLLVDDFYDTGKLEHPYEGKKKCIQSILERTEENPKNVVIIGDSVKSELKAAKEFGAMPVQIVRPGVTPSYDPEIRKIESLGELAFIVQEINLMKKLFR